MAKFLWAAILAVLMGCVSSGTPHGGGADGSGDNGGGDDTAAAAVITTVVTALIESGHDKELVEIALPVNCDGEEAGMTGEELNLPAEKCTRVTVGDARVIDEDDELPVIEGDDGSLWTAPAQAPSEELEFRLGRYLWDGTEVTCGWVDGSCYEPGECQTSNISYKDGNVLEGMPMVTMMVVEGSTLEGDHGIGEFTSPDGRMFIDDISGRAMECWPGTGAAR